MLLTDGYSVANHLNGAGISVYGVGWGGYQFVTKLSHSEQGNRLSWGATSIPRLHSDGPLPYCFLGGISDCSFKATQIKAVIGKQKTQSPPS